MVGNNSKRVSKQAGESRTKINLTATPSHLFIHTENKKTGWTHVHLMDDLSAFGGITN